MPKIKIVCFGGRIGFFLRKVMPSICSKIYLNIARKKSNSTIKKYIKNKDLGEFSPIFISVETINRCNGTCSFCPCNVVDEKRPYKYMEDDMFYKIIDDLNKHDYSNTLMLLANNEILLDKNILQRLEYARKKVPNCHLKMFTNGKLLDDSIFSHIIDNNLVDEMIINNYNTSMELNSPIKKIYEKYKNFDFKQDIQINIRYSKEVLSNRANSSPNKKGEKIIKDYCCLPFTDININPYGNMLICCCDATEKTNMGNVMDKDLFELFNDKKYIELRKNMINGRNKNEFCKYCDFNDVGTRKHLMINYLSERK